MLLLQSVNIMLVLLSAYVSFSAHNFMLMSCLVSGTNFLAIVRVNIMVTAYIKDGDSRILRRLKLLKIK